MINDMNISNESRQIRGYSILAKGDEPQKVGQSLYRIPSQNGNGVYLVTLRKYLTECMCSDYQTRKIECKHIHAVRFWLKFRKAIQQHEQFEIPMQKESICIYCNSKRIVKCGKTNNKQRFLCRQCRRTFVGEKEFKKLKGNGKIITLVLDLYFSGLSLRKIKRHLKQFYDFDVNHATIYRWIRKFTKIINNYVSGIKPSVSGMWNVDEQAINVKTKDRMIWNWNVIDSETRFLITNLITETREIEDARKVFEKVKMITRQKPHVIITDGLWSYEKAIVKEFGSKPADSPEHIRLESIRSHINNNKVERFHNTFRERDKTVRGFFSPATAQLWSDGFRNYYNFIRPHMTLGMTPAEKANIHLQLGQNKWLNLIKQASTKVQQEALNNSNTQ